MNFIKKKYFYKYCFVDFTLNLKLISLSLQLRGSVSDEPFITIIIIIIILILLIYYNVPFIIFLNFTDLLTITLTYNHKKCYTSMYCLKILDCLNPILSVTTEIELFSCNYRRDTKFKWRSVA